MNFTKGATETSGSAHQSWPINQQPAEHKPENVRQSIQRGSWDSL
jgi:hypothetical protein